MLEIHCPGTWLNIQHLTGSVLKGKKNVSRWVKQLLKSVLISAKYGDHGSMEYCLRNNYTMNQTHLSVFAETS